MMPEWVVREQPLHALKEPSDFKEELPLMGVWNFATLMFGAQCVMTSGVDQMLKLPAGS